VRTDNPTQTTTDGDDGEDASRTPETPATEDDGTPQPKEKATPPPSKEPACVRLPRWRARAARAAAFYTQLCANLAGPR
jgi:hypothetical protein